MFKAFPASGQLSCSRNHSFFAKPAARIALRSVAETPKTPKKMGKTKVGPTESSEPKEPPLITVDPSQYEEQLEKKTAKIRAQFSNFNMPDIEVFKSKPSHYRMRTEFAVWHRGDDMFYVMHDRSQTPPKQIRVDEFSVASELINQLMKAMVEVTAGSSILREKLFQMNFHTTLSGG